MRYSIVLSVAAAASTALLPGNASAVVRGRTDAIRQFAHITVLRVQAADGSQEWCSASVLDDHTILTAAHCVLGGAGRALHDYDGPSASRAAQRRGRPTGGAGPFPPKSIFISARRGSVGRVYVSKAYIHPEYVAALAGSGGFQAASRYDVAILKTDDRIREYTSATFVDTPQTILARGDGNELHGEKSQPIDYKKLVAITDAQIEAKLVKLIGATGSDAMIGGFGCTQEEDCRRASALPTNYLSFDTPVGEYSKGRCLLQARPAAIFLAPQSCYVPAPSPEGTTSNAAVGDSGGPVSVARDAGTPGWFGNLETAPPQAVVALTSWGEGASLSVNANLAPNSRFIIAAITETGGLKPLMLQAAKPVKEPPLKVYALDNWRGLTLGRSVEVRLGLGDGMLAITSDECTIVFVEAESEGGAIRSDPREYERRVDCLGDFGPYSGLAIALAGEITKNRGISTRATGANLLDPAGNVVARFRVVPHPEVEDDGYFFKPTYGNSASEAVPSEDRPMVALGLSYLFWDVWSERSGASNEKNELASLNEMYAPRVDYFGKIVPRQEAMADKDRFRKRWINRDYRVRNGTAHTTCSAGRCTVTGIVDWTVSTLSASRKSSGSARFMLTFDAHGKVTTERTDVLERTPLDDAS